MWLSLVTGQTRVRFINEDYLCISVTKIKVNDYGALIAGIGNILEQGRKQAIVAVNQILVKTYWEIGKQIVKFEQKGEKRAKYGKELMFRLSEDLTSRYGKGFTERNIRNMRQFYATYPKWHAVRTELAWTHQRLLLKIEEPAKRSFYEQECIKNKWSTRQLERQINSLLFDRLALSRDKKKLLNLAKEGNVIAEPEDVIKEPYILEFLGLQEESYESYYTETRLEQALIEHLKEFILELGRGFTFVSRQKRITIEDDHYYIDLVFYHRILKCIILIDLKIGKLTHQDIGQMNFYLNYFKEYEVEKGENPPIGLILCTDKNNAMVKFALGGISNKLFVSKYKLYLPSEKELRAELIKEREYIQDKSSQKSPSAL